MGQIIRLINSRTKEEENYEETALWYDGSLMDDAKVDNFIYRKKGLAYYKNCYVKHSVRTSLFGDDLQDCVNTVSKVKDIRLIIVDSLVNLNKRTITLPDQVTIRFSGGLISDGVLIGRDTNIEADNKILHDVDVEGSWSINAWIPEWWGAVGSANVISTKAFQSSLNAARATNIKKVYVAGQSYAIDDELLMYNSTQLLGSYDGTKHYTHNQINQLSNKNAIRVLSDTEDIQRVSIKNISFYCRYEGVDKSNIGIRVYNNENTSGMSSCTFDNVWIGFFHTGFKLDCAGGKGVGYNVFERVTCRNNVIGMHFKGDFSNTTTANSSKSWMNLNRFEGCQISANSIGGVWFDNMRSTEQNIFATCGIEGNGTEYSYTNYLAYLGAGWGVRVDNGGSVRGYITLRDCYIENNTPRRSIGIPELGEHIYNGYIRPDDAITNIFNASVVLNMGNIVIENCVINLYALFAGVAGQFEIKLLSNNWSFSASAAKDIDYLILVKTTTSSYTDRSQIYVDEHFANNVSDGFYRLQMGSLYKFTEDSYLTNISYLSVYSNGVFGLNEISCKQRTVYSNRFFLDSENSSSSELMGYTKKDALSTFSSFMSKNRLLSPSISKVVISVLSRSRVGTPTLNYNNSFRHIELVGENAGAELFVENENDRIQALSDLTFRNLKIAHSNPLNYYPFINIYNSNINIEFINCEIVLDKNQTYLLVNNSNRNNHVRFINCTFLISNNVSNVLDIVRPSDAPMDVVFIDCVIPSEYIVRYDNLSVSSVSSITQNKTFKGSNIFLPDAPIIHNGDKWVRYDGASAETRISGNFDQKPAQTDIYIGFKYFCTDRKTAEGDTNGIEIIHKGSGVWVDALGRVVS